MDNIKYKYVELKKELAAANKKIDLLQNAQNKFDVLVNHMDDFVWITNKNLEFTYVSPSIKNMLGFTQKEFLQKSMIDFGAPESKALILKGYTDRIKGRSDDTQKYWITQGYHKNGNVIWLETSTKPIINNKGEFEGVLGVSRNITKQKLSELALKDSENRLKLLVANLPSASYRCLPDKHWTMKFISNEILNLSGYPPSDFIDNKKRSYASIIHPEDTEYVELIITEKIKEKESFAIEYRIIHKNGETQWVHEQGRGNYNKTGKIETIDGFVSNITLRKKNEKKLRISEYNLSILSNASVDMLSFTSNDEILIYAADILSKKLNNSTVIAFLISENRNFSKFVHISGINSDIRRKLKEVTNIISRKNTFEINKEINKDLHTGRLLEYKNSFEKFASLQLSKTNSKILKHLLKIDKIYYTGITKNEELFGALHIFPKNKLSDEDITFIESFTNLTSIVIQRQQLIDVLNNSEKKFRTIFENTNSAISIQTDKKHLLVNKAWQKITGYSAAEAKILEPIELIHPTDKNRISALTKKRLQGEDVPIAYLFHLIDKHLNEKWIDVSATVIDYEGQKASLIIGTDITERKKYDIELNKFSTGIMNSPLSIVITDIDGTIEYVNPFFTQTTGYSYNEAIGKNPRVLSSGNNSMKLYENLWSTILRGEVWHGEFQNIKKNGQFYWESARIAPIFDTNGIITSFIAIKEDITERKKNIELIEQSAKDLKEINAKKDKFFSIIAHDLRSPFSGLAGLTNLLMSSLNKFSDEEIKNYIELINKSSQHIFKLLENLLAWAKTQTGRIEFKPANINLNLVVNNTVGVIALSAKNKEIDIEINIDKNTTVFADENMLNTILRNLISNALKYTHKNGLIKISSEIRTIKNIEYSVIAINDNGVGIPKDKQNKIFIIEDNYTTIGTEKEKGTGLGLILCKEFVEKHHGKIWCKSEENSGSTFYFSLPVTIDYEI